MNKESKIEKLYKGVFYLILFVLCSIFNILSSSLILAGEMTAFEIMISGLIYFSTLTAAFYILFCRINMNIFIHLGSLLLFAYMMIYNYNTNVHIINTISVSLISFGLLLEVLDLFGITFNLKVNVKKKRRISKQRSNK